MLRLKDYSKKSFLEFSLRNTVQGRDGFCLYHSVILCNKSLNVQIDNPVHLNVNLCIEVPTSLHIYIHTYRYKPMRINYDKSFISNS